MITKQELVNICHREVKVKVRTREVIKVAVTLLVVVVVVHIKTLITTISIRTNIITSIQEIGKEISTRKLQITSGLTTKELVPHKEAKIQFLLNTLVIRKKIILLLLIISNL